MRCKQCDYSLWNIRARQCPECGGAFKPSDFRFATNAVRFCCPHCGQDYYGTGADGHLQPRAFDCVACGRALDMDEMVLRPTEGVDERLTKAERNPWLDDDRGLVARWCATLYHGACTPTWLMRVTPVESGPGQAWGFAIFSHVVVGLLVVLPFLLFAFVLGLAMGGGAARGLTGFGVGWGVIAVIGSLVLLGLWVLTTHGVLRLRGPTAGGIGRTAQALCYTCGPQLAFLAPCVGLYVGWAGSLWWVIVAGFAVAGAQRVGGVRAAVAVSALPVLCIAILGVVFIGLVASSATTTVTVDSVAGSGSRIDAYRAPLMQARLDGSWPGHVGELLLDGSIGVEDLRSEMSLTTAHDVRIGADDMPTWRSLSPESQRRAVEGAAVALPGDTVAYRVGDFVFTYPGIDPAVPSAGLWLVVEAWDPRVSGQRRQSEVAVLLDDGQVRRFGRDGLGPALEAQNQLRADAGLAPLPNPFSVRSGRPATASERDDPG